MKDYEPLTASTPLCPIRMSLPPAGTPDFDFHTHNLQATPGRALVCIPPHWLINPTAFKPRQGLLYAAGIHPWDTANSNCTTLAMTQLPTLLSHPQVVALGECGLDALRGADLYVQEKILVEQLKLAEQYKLPVVIHAVRTTDRLLRLHKQLKPTCQWTIHGFRGGAATARQLLNAGFDLSFGKKYNAEAYDLTPDTRKRYETDDPLSPEDMP